MQSEAEELQAPESVTPSVVADDEPQLKYEQLGQDVLTIIAGDRVSCLCLSDKILALGTERGHVHVCDYSGNEVRGFAHHQGRITDISFDKEEEYLATCSEDSTVMVLNLYSQESVRFQHKKPVKTIALDPRYSARKTREFVTGAASGAVVMSAQGWLGRSETTLHMCDSPVEVVRWTGTLLAWGTATTAMVYDTTSHERVRTIKRTPHGAFAGHTRCSLLFGHDRQLYVSWPDCIKVGKIYTSENNIGGVTSQIEVVATIDTNYFVMGVAPFDHHLAVLTYTPPREAYDPPQQTAVPEAKTSPAGDPAASSSATPTVPPPAAGASTSATVAPQSGATSPAPGSAAASPHPGASPRAPPLTPPGTATAGPPTTSLAGIPPRAASKVVPRVGAPLSAAAEAALPPARMVAHGGQPELRIITTANVQLAADALPVAHGQAYGPHDYWLVPSLPTSSAPDAAAAALGSAAARPARGSAGAPVVVTGSAAAPWPAVASALHSSGAGGGGGATSGAAVSTSGTSTPQRGAGGAAAASGRSSEAGGGRAPPVAGEYVAGQEFMYYIVTPQDVLVGRSRDATDRVVWLLERKQFEAALHIAENDRSVPRAMYEKVVQGYIEDLLEAEAYEAAAQLSPRLLKDSASLWERWVYMFAQWRQLPKLARFVPCESPRLSSTAYEMVLNSLLAASADHPLVLELAQRWPSTIYSMPSLVDSVAARMKRAGGDTPALWQLLAWLYQQQGRPDLALSIWLQLGSPTVFDFIRRHALFTNLVGRAAQLLAIDERLAVGLLTQHADVIHPSSVVPNIQDAMADAAQHGGAAAAELWRRRLHRYLDTLFETDALAGSEYHELQVQLYADYAPGRLMDFLVSSQYYAFEAALAICESRKLVPEQVFLLGRMGNATQALHLIIEQLGDIPQAIEFVRSQRDDELWDNLISWALSSPDTTGSLLDHIGGHINPLHLVQRIPKGMAIPGLRDRLRSIIADFRTQTSLREGCNVILRSDCSHLLQRLYRDVRRGVPTLLAYRPEVAAHRPGQWLRCETAWGHMEPVPAADVPPAALLPASSPPAEPPRQQQAGGSGRPPGAGGSRTAGSGRQAEAPAAAGTSGRAAGDKGGGPRVWIGFPSAGSSSYQDVLLVPLEPASARGRSSRERARGAATQATHTLPSLLRPMPA